MANAVKLFVDPAGTYTGGYTSHMVESTFAAHSSNITRGVIQANVETGGRVSLQMRLTLDARWVEIAVYHQDIIEEVVTANFMQVVVTGDAKVWLGETT